MQTPTSASSLTPERPCCALMGKGEGGLSRSVAVGRGTANLLLIRMFSWR